MTSVSFLSLSLGPPVISTPPEDQFVINNGSSAMFTCGALAIPPHEVYWIFTNASGVTSQIISTMDNMDTTDYQINRDMNNTDCFGTLTVTDVRYMDRGVYTCNATNEIGSDLANATLTVHGKSPKSIVKSILTTTYKRMYFSLMISPRTST